MKNNYLRFTKGEVSVYCGDTCRDNVYSSLVQAKTIAASSLRGNILYVNTIFTTRKLLSAARTVLSSCAGAGEELSPEAAQQWKKERFTKLSLTGGTDIIFQHVIIGDLCKYLEEIRAKIAENNVGYLIINSWDFANRSYGFKEKALFGLLNIAEDLDISVLVYSQSTTSSATPGMTHRGGLGKLAAIADMITYVESEPIGESQMVQRMEEIREPDAIEQEENVSTEEPASREIEKLSHYEINELDYARSETGVSSGGELVLHDEEAVFDEELMEL